MGAAAAGGSRRRGRRLSNSIGTSSGIVINLLDPGKPSNLKKSSPYPTWVRRIRLARCDPRPAPLQQAGRRRRSWPGTGHERCRAIDPARALSLISLGCVLRKPAGTVPLSVLLLGTPAVTGIKRPRGFIEGEIGLTRLSQSATAAIVIQVAGQYWQG